MTHLIDQEHDAQQAAHADRVVVAAAAAERPNHHQLHQQRGDGHALGQQQRARDKLAVAAVHSEPDAQRVARQQRQFEPTADGEGRRRAVLEEGQAEVHQNERRENAPELDEKLAAAQRVQATSTG